MVARQRDCLGHKKTPPTASFASPVTASTPWPVLFTACSPPVFRCSPSLLLLAPACPHLFFTRSSLLILLAVQFFSIQCINNTRTAIVLDYYLYVTQFTLNPLFPREERTGLCCGAAFSLLAGFHARDRAKHRLCPVNLTRVTVSFDTSCLPRTPPPTRLLKTDSSFVVSCQTSYTFPYDDLPDLLFLWSLRRIDASRYADRQLPVNHVNKPYMRLV